MKALALWLGLLAAFPAFAQSIPTPTPTGPGGTFNPSDILNPFGTKLDVSGLGQPGGAARQNDMAGVLNNTFSLSPYITSIACATDQTSNIAAGLAAAAAYAPGNRIVWPSGCILHSGLLTNTGSLWTGGGYSYTGGTELRYTALSGSSVQLMGSGAKVAGFRITTTQAASTATAIQMADGVSNPSSQAIDDIAVVGFAVQIDVQSGQYWHINHFDLHNATLYGLRIRNLANADSGDGNLSSGTIYADDVVTATQTATAIRYESGGGLKVRGTKVLQFGYAFVLAVSDGAITSDLSIDESNSFENQHINAIQLGQAGPNNTGTFGNVLVKPQVANGRLVSGPGISNAVYGGIYNNTDVAIRISGGNNIAISSDLTVNTASVGGIDIQDPATNVTVPLIRCNACTAIVVDERTSGAGPVVRHDRRPINLAQSSTYTNFYEIDVPSYRGVRIEVLVEGTLQSAGSIDTFLNVLIANNGSSMGSPGSISNVQAGSAPVDIQFNTSTQGVILIGVRPNPGYGGGNVTGSLTIHVEGQSSKFKAL